MCSHYVRLQLSRQHAPKPPSQLQGRDTSRLAASWQQASQHWQAAQPGQCALLTRRDLTTSIASCPLARSQGTAAAEAASHGEGRYQSPALADWPQWAGKSTGWSPFGVAASMRKLRVPASRAPSCQLGAMPRVGPRQARTGRRQWELARGSQALLVSTQKLPRQPGHYAGGQVRCVTRLMSEARPLSSSTSKF